MPSNQPPAAIRDDTVICRSTDVLSAGVGAETVMMTVDTGYYYGLDDIGSEIWQRLETPRKFSELVDSLVADYDADRAVIAEDVRMLLTDMAAHGVLRFD